MIRLHAPAAATAAAVTVPPERSAKVLESFALFNNYQNTLDRFIDIESNHGRAVSKYIALINCPAGMAHSHEKGDNVFEPYREKIQALEHVVREKEDRIKWLDQEINNYANSMSWSITAPLRAMRGFLTSKGGSR